MVAWEHEKRKTLDRIKDGEGKGRINFLTGSDRTSFPHPLAAFEAKKNIYTPVHPPLCQK
jgi:hypothetical protein